MTSVPVTNFLESNFIQRPRRTTSQIFKNVFLFSILCVGVRAQVEIWLLDQVVNYMVGITALPSCRTAVAADALF
jgi:hypothetical protein